MATLKDIADELGLSAATVSRALNGFPEVNAQTRALVEETAQRLNYRPGRTARGRVPGRAGFIGLVARRVGENGSEAGLVALMSGLSRQLARAGVDLVVNPAASSDLLAPYKRLIAKQAVDGFIVTAPDIDDPRVAFLRAERVPFVVHGKAHARPDYAYYAIDNRAAALAAVTQLADLGHRRIALINNESNRSNACAREEGFLEATAARGLRLAGFATVEDAVIEADGYAAATQLLSGWHGPRPTAIFCASKEVALGVLSAAADLGFAVPRDLSVIAQDDGLPPTGSESAADALTCLRAPLASACAPLAAAITGLITGGSPRDYQTTVVPELVPGRSCGPVPPGDAAGW